MSWYQGKEPRKPAIPLKNTSTNVAPSANDAAPSTTQSENPPSSESDIREADKTVMKKRVVTVAQEEATFQIVLSPMAQAIEERFQQLVSSGLIPSEAIRSLMHAVGESEYPAFREWLKFKEQ